MTALVLAALYPPPTGFPHARHVAVPCARCHEAVERAIRPGGAAVQPAVCASCHADGRVFLAPAEAPAAIRFGHRPHLARGARCADCHAADARAPTMATCLGCHDGARASGRCATCHLTRPDGRLRVAWPGWKLVPRDHSAPDFGAGHGRQAAAAPDTCASCHAESACSACHDGVVRPLEIHPADYLSTHAAPARRNDPDCTKCHRLATFCVTCHTQAGVTDRPGRYEFAGRAFHPAGWVDYLGGPSDHGTEARRNLRACVGCHEEDTCVRCHSTDATATLRASPHPPGFDRHCGRALDANARGCAKCHRDRAALERLCDQ